MKDTGLLYLPAVPFSSTPYWRGNQSKHSLSPLKSPMEFQNLGTDEPFAGTRFKAGSPGVLQFPSSLTYPITLKLALTDLNYLLGLERANCSASTPYIAFGAR
jgi:hypothetical protein